MTVQVNVKVEEQVWKKLRDLAEDERRTTRGHASVASIVARMISDSLQRVDRSREA